MSRSARGSRDRWARAGVSLSHCVFRNTRPKASGCHKAAWLQIRLRKCARALRAAMRGAGAAGYVCCTLACAPLRDRLSESAVQPWGGAAVCAMMRAHSRRSEGGTAKLQSGDGLF
jgi:hypothetical protein